MKYNKNNYLDQSLDDMIKMKNKRKQRTFDTRQKEPRRPAIKRPELRTKPNINDRVGKAVPPKRPVSERNNNLIIRSRPPVQKPIVDPSQIVITKTIKRNNKSEKKTATNLVINRNLEKAHAKVKKEEDLATSPVQQPQSLPEKSKIVLLCNLDPRATAKDIGDTCAMFGPITSCDLLLDPMGRSLYEAEIEFVYPDSAEQCVAKLDNKLVDGRMLRARLQKSPTLPVKPRYSSRTVSASARVAQGGFNDPTPTIPPEYAAPQPVTQPNYPYYQQYQQQFYNKRF